MEELPSNLGLPLGARHRARATWNPIVEEVEGWLDRWKARTLSRGGRLTLLRCALSNLPIYFMSFLMMPAMISKRIEGAMSIFLWNLSKEKSIYLMRWPRLCAPLEKGGLGLRSLSIMNKTLLFKWLWRFGEEMTAVWRNIIAAKYETDRTGWASAYPTDAHGFGVWKAIAGGYKEFNRHISFIVGRGT